MKDSKYPYVPKEYYPAVIFACKMIRENGYFHKAISTSAEYYNVDEEKLEKYVRERQGAGQKGKSRTYKWYSVIGVKYDWFETEDCGDCTLWGMTADECIEKAQTRVIKASSDENMLKRIDGNHPIGRDYTSHYVLGYKVFDSENEARNYDWDIDEIEKLARKEFRRL